VKLFFRKKTCYQRIVDEIASTPLVVTTVCEGVGWYGYITKKLESNWFKQISGSISPMFSQGATTSGFAQGHSTAVLGENNTAAGAYNIVSVGTNQEYDSSYSVYGGYGGTSSENNGTFAQGSTSTVMYANVSTSTDFSMNDIKNMS